MFALFLFILNTSIPEVAQGLQAHWQKEDYSLDKDVVFPIFQGHVGYYDTVPLKKAYDREIFDSKIKRYCDKNDLEVEWNTRQSNFIFGEGTIKKQVEMYAGQMAIVHFNVRVWIKEDNYFYLIEGIYLEKYPHSGESYVSIESWLEMRMAFKRRIQENYRIVDDGIKSVITGIGRALR
ncbi:MAG: hypothetical protein U0T82_10720 [Bacteroidales bacterium]